MAPLAQDQAVVKLRQAETNFSRSCWGESTLLRTNKCGRIRSKIAATIPADKALRPLNPGDCPLVY
jgi:hypothetical protein